MLSYLFLPHSTINGSPKCYCKQIINFMLMEKKSVPLLFSQMLNFFCFTYCMSFIHVTNKFLPVRPIYMSVIQVTQPVGYVGTLPAIRINESTAEWTTRDCYV